MRNWSRKIIFLLEEDADHQIWLDGPFIRVPQLKIDVYTGQYLVFDEDEEDYMPDFSIYVFMKLGTKEVVYDEGNSNLGAALNNYSRRYKEFENVQISQLALELHIAKV